ncbi:hypothetical protein GCM10027034_37460 [Ramlibacter solisilvae]|uniref:Uncharacterized protein n=2 Tax=Ramlibacter tataouinensis TaxID=94132 RepID=A0A127JUV4_9BURK|nr:hypothetical protein UC35_13285 [Ramlibacter tataouinensis]
MTLSWTYHTFKPDAFQIAKLQDISSAHSLPVWFSQTESFAAVKEEAGQMPGFESLLQVGP